MNASGFGPRPGGGPSLITGEELSRRGDIGRCELVRGQIVLASPTSDEHGGIEGDFYHELRSFDLPRKLGKVRVADPEQKTVRAYRSLED